MVWNALQFGNLDDFTAINICLIDLPQLGDTLSRSRLVANSHNFMQASLLFRASCLAIKVAILTLPSRERIL